VEAAELLNLLQRSHEVVTALTGRLRELAEQADGTGSAIERWIRLGGSSEAAARRRETLRKASASLGEVGTALGGVQREVSLLLRERSHQITLLNISQELNTAADLTELLNVVMDDLIGASGAERGFLLLFDATHQHLEVAVARDNKKQTLSPPSYQISWSVVNRVAESQRAVLADNAREDPRFAAATSVLTFALRSILCTPLHVAGRLVGVVYLDNRVVSGLFGAADLDLLRVFANQSAAMIESARLLSSLRSANTRMRMIFNSVASGVITTDIQGRITTYNPAAERIFGFTIAEALGSSYEIPLEMTGQTVLAAAIERVLREGHPIAGEELACVLRRRGPVWLNISLSPLKDEHGETTGSALVVQDVTENKRLVAEQEKERRRFEELLEIVVPIAVALSAEADFEGLLERLVVEAMNLTDADGGTLYLVEGDSLRFAIVRNRSLGLAYGGTSGEQVPFASLPLYDPQTRAPDHRHIATHAALAGGSVNLPDVQRTTEFDVSGARAFDSRFGYRTTSVLTSPLLDNHGQVNGVLELINTHDPRTGAVAPFDGRLVRTVETLARLAGLVLQASLREQGLRREIEELRIEVDEAKQASAVAAITGTEYFESLQSKAREMRARRAHAHDDA
jgi:PAS domain S-box-containing protein